MSKAGATALVLIAIISVIGATMIASTIVYAQEKTVVSTTTVTSSSGGAQLNSSQLASLPGVVNQKPVSRYYTLTWLLSPQAVQDRFTPDNIIVAQGDTVHLTFIVNDTVAHTFTIGPPYNFQINVSTPGLVNDLTHNNFTQNATNNSPGVVISGTPGNLTGTGSFVAKYTGVFEYWCVYHVQVGMFGYLTVLPNAAYSNASSTSTSTTTANATNSGQVSIAYGSATNETTSYYSPSVITVIIGKNNTVTWVNDDIAPHTVTSDTSGQFDSGPIADHGATWTHTFDTPGTYTYHCSYHPWMHGTIIVKSQ